MFEPSVQGGNTKTSAADEPGESVHPGSTARYSASVHGLSALLEIAEHSEKEASSVQAQLIRTLLYRLLALARWRYFWTPFCGKGLWSIDY